VLSFSPSSFFFSNFGVLVNVFLLPFLLSVCPRICNQLPLPSFLFFTVSFRPPFFQKIQTLLRILRRRPDGGVLEHFNETSGTPPPYLRDEPFFFPLFALRILFRIVSRRNWPLFLQLFISGLCCVTFNPNSPFSPCHMFFFANLEGSCSCSCFNSEVLAFFSSVNPLFPFRSTRINRSMTQAFRIFVPPSQVSLRFSVLFRFIECSLSPIRAVLLSLD